MKCSSPCNAVWNSITIYPNGKLAPCCIYDYQLARDSDQFQGSDTFADLQEQMSQGAYPVGCRKCWEDEQNGMNSYRENYGSDPNQRDRIRYLDLRNNNTCNLTCRICGPAFSSSWTKLVGDLEFENFNISPILSEISESNLDEIYFTGGEPMLNIDHWRLLDRLVVNGHSKNITLRYNTNLSILSYQGRSVFDYWPKFKKIKVYASLEAIGEPVEYIRSGLDWNRATKNINALLDFQQQYPDTEISVFCTVGLLNVWFLPDLVAWCHERDILLDTAVLEGPDFLSLSTLPHELTDLVPEIEFAKDRNQLHNSQVLNLAKSKIGDTEHLFLHAITHMLMMDRLKGDRLFDLMPKLLQDFAKRRVLLV